MTGSAAPIFDAERKVIAVLDVSSDSYLPPSPTLGMVTMMSQTMENRLILDLFHGQHFQLTFNAGLDDLDSRWAGLFIFDEDGQVLSTNPPGRQPAGHRPVAGQCRKPVQGAAIGAAEPRPKDCPPLHCEPQDATAFSTC